MGEDRKPLAGHAENGPTSLRSTRILLSVLGVLVLIVGVGHLLAGKVIRGILDLALGAIVITVVYRRRANRAS